MTKKCWICGNEIIESAVDSLDIFYGKLRLVNVHRPYASNHTSKPVYICQKCMKNKIGVDAKGKNLNP